MFLMGGAPRLRGVHAILLIWGLNYGWSPAPAGSALCGWSPGSAPSVEPRACGASLSIEPIQGRLAGLSPRLRGGSGSPDFLVSTRGWTPSSAGQTSWWCERFQLSGVDPRVYGADCLLVIDPLAAAG